MDGRWCLALLLAVAASGVELPTPLNVVIVLVDDLGWKDAGFLGSPQFHTPTIDRLARDGVAFPNAYANAPNCAPTRACLLSGQYPPRHGIYTVYDERHTPGKPHQRILAIPTATALPADGTTLAGAFHAQGYATGIFGMWNLGTGRSGAGSPLGQGFDQYVRPKDLGFANDRYWNADHRELTTALTDAAIAFTAAQRGPFFLYLPYHAVHIPLEPDPAEVAAIRARAESGPAPAEYVATVERVDHEVARLLSALERQGHLGRTVVVYTSDNGGTRDYGAPLRGGKGELYEGGLRVPLVVWGAPGGKAGHRPEAPVISLDLYPTLLDLAGVARPARQVLDGASLVPLLAGGTQLDRAALFWHFPCYVGRQTPGSAIRAGDTKLIEWFEDHHVEMYDLANDPGETRDLAASQPERRDRLYRQLQDWQRSTGAAIPTQANPAFDPAARFHGGDGPDKGGDPGPSPGRGGGHRRDHGAGRQGSDP